tara:strand:- start:2562 stop:3671 length:1110 start_codon:yes stop_codon:yes gene_type:complete
MNLNVGAHNITYSLLIISCSVQLFYLVFFYLRLIIYKEIRQEKTHTTAVSIIICAKNEAHNLNKNLSFILNQKHAIFEVIVVNHDSTDNSEKVLSQFEKKHDNLKVLFFKNNKNGKKEPISYAIEHASYEHLIFTDADCKPNSNLWINKFSNGFKKREIIIGYGPHTKTKGILNFLVRLDTAIIGITYLSYALSKFGYMAVGRNMGYTKNVFKSTNGFASHKDIVSGDDDLFIQKAIEKDNFNINIDPDTYCFSDTPKSWKSWLNQKNRHHSSSNKYKVINKALLGIYPLSLVLMWFSFVSLFCEVEYRSFGLSFFCFVLLIKWIIQGAALNKIKEHSFIILFPFLELIQNLIMIVFFSLKGLNKKNKW